MSGRIRVALVFLALLALCWVGAVLWWQCSPQIVTSSDLLIGLLLVPLSVCVAVGLGWLGWRRFSAPAAATAPIATTAADESPKALAAPTEVLVLAAGISTAGGDVASAVIEGIAGGELMPGPEAEFLDFDGMPVRMQRVADLGVDDVHDWLAVEGAECSALPSSFLRALALVPAALLPVIEQVVAAMPEPVSRHAAPRALPIVVRALVPQSWNESHQALAMRWIEHLIARVWSETAPPVRLTASGDSGTALGEIRAWQADTTQIRNLLLLALDSQIDEGVIERAASEGLLFAHDRPEGLVPGEAAAAVLLARPATANGWPVLARLHPPLSAQRDAPPRATGRADAALLESLLSAALDGVATSADAVAAVFSEGDVRPTRAVEIAAAMNNVLPHLDPVADRVGLGAALGDLGAAGTTLALALAAAHTEQTQKPTLLAALADPLSRGVLLLQAYEPESATS
ncbi:hypothetical protein [Niveibacterium sp.]|uniref:hypothetical protein n=1 Tax=Niveibacterium sp. TaxID=2017444 RepID=UPI0035AF9060